MRLTVFASLVLLAGLAALFRTRRINQAGARSPRAHELDELTLSVRTVGDVRRYLEPLSRSEVVAG